MERPRRWLARSVVVVSLTGLACQPDVDVCARVGRHKVETAALQAYLGAVTGQAWQAVEERVAGRLFDQFLDQEVVAAAARVNRPMRIPIEPGERAATVRALLDEVCGPQPVVDEALVEGELGRRQGEARPARAHVRQLQLDSAEEAEAVRRRLVAGEDFTALSRQVSRAPNADSGGEIGDLVQGTLPSDLDRAIFALRPGEISSPVRGPSGYHLFQVLAVHDAGSPNPEAERDRVRRELKEQQTRTWHRECVDRLARQVGVTVHLDHLWFRYQGRYTEENHGTQANPTRSPNGL